MDKRLRFDRYYRYADLVRFLREFQRNYPKLCKLESIGKSYEGRDVWLCKVTDFTTGPDSEKPAFWVDGNIHATEVSASSACLYLLNKLMTRFGKDKKITHLMKTRALYIVPRVNPDGAEWALADKPKYIRSSTRPYPYSEDPVEGLEWEDIDGDGRALQMRIKDPNGPWKVSKREPRLMVRREPTDLTGDFYRVLLEGNIRNYDGVMISIPPKKEGLDLNRNFPADWRLEGEQVGAGPYPTSEPEVKNLVHFMTNHPNICGAITYHTFSGVLLRPFTAKDDEKFAAEDLWTYKYIGAKGTELTGYPNISVYHEFRYHPNEVITGVFDDWCVEHLGIFAWTTEIWSPQRHAGIKEYKYIDWYREHPFEDDLALLKWSDEKLDGRGYVDWYEYNHPQLGKVELGGWDFNFCWRNPPPKLLEKEIAPHANFVIFHALCTPKLELHSQEAEDLGGGAYRLQVVVQNTGFLPTNVMKEALKKKIVRPVVAEIKLPKRASLQSGKLREEFGQLDGYAYKNTSPVIWTADPTTDRLKLVWVVAAPEGGKVEVTVKHPRAGLVRTEFRL